MKKSTPAYKIGTSSRGNLGYDTKTPGPGTYGSLGSFKTGPEVKFGTDVRKPLNGN